MKANILFIELFMVKVGSEKKKEVQKHKNYTLMVDTFMKKFIHNNIISFISL